MFKIFSKKEKISYDHFVELLHKSGCKAFCEAYREQFYKCILKGKHINEFKVDKKLLEQAEIALEQRYEEDRRLSETARLNNIGIIAEKEGRIDDAIMAYEENINIGYQASYAYERLRIIYRKRKDFTNMARVIRRYAQVYGYDNDWAQEQINRYSGSIKRKKVDYIYPLSRLRSVVSGETIEDRYNKIIERQPEFDFYVHTDYTQMQYSFDDSKISFPDCVKLREIREEIKSKLELSATNERCGRLDLACVDYEWLIANKVHNTKPYDRLFMIYKRSGLIQDACEVLDEGIKFFSSLRERQWEYIEYLSSKYNVTEIKGKPLKDYGVIHYYMGEFELYNPYHIVEKWKEKLQKIKAQHP